MLLNRTVWLRAAMCVVSAVMVFTAAAWLRLNGLTDPHAHPVELAYVSLAMKMGQHSALSQYDLSGIQILVRPAADRPEAGPPVPIITPAHNPPAEPAARWSWPVIDSNPFLYKPPLFAALLAYSHHRFLGAGFAHYPVSSALHTGTPAQIKKSLIQIQGWATVIPYASGLALVLITIILGWRLFGPAAGVLAGGILTVYPAQLLISTQILPEALLSVWILVVYWLCLHFGRTANPAGYLIAGGVWALAALTDTAAFFTLPAFAVWMVWMDKKFRCRYLAAFAVGSVYVYKVWPDHLKRTFDASLWSRADLGSAVPAGWGPDHWPASITTLILWLLPIAALASTIYFFINKHHQDDPRQKEVIAVLWLMILGIIVSRLIYAHSAPWDARAVAMMIPFAALLAAQAVRFR